MERLTQQQSTEYRKLNPNKDFRYGMGNAIGYTLTPSTHEGFEDVVYFAEAYKDPTGSLYPNQYVYVMVNESVPNVVKIGYTRLSVEERARQLSSASGCITPWFPVFKYRAANAYALEQDVHSFLEARGVRLNHKREGFVMKSEEAVEIIQELGKKYTKSN